MARDSIRSCNIAIIGGGSAGLAAAIAAHDAGVDDVVVIERDAVLGGILNQCIHNGFGLHTFKEELTGPEYASRFIAQADERHIDRLLRTTVLDVTASHVVRAVSADRGVFSLEAKAIVLAMGCRERPRGALDIAGFRPAGVYTAGCAQKLVNVDGYLPGRRVVILGSGDVGLIMARRLTLEGARVACVAELMPYSGGLKRNIVQCLDDFDIPLHLSHTVTRIEGPKRVEAVTIARVDERLRPIPGTDRRYECDTLLLSVGLLPENELSRQAGVKLSPVTQGPEVSESLETSIEGIFACGNVLHVHDLVDYVSEEAALAGRRAACYVKEMRGGVAGTQREGGAMREGGDTPSRLRVRTGGGVRYTVPSFVSPDLMDERLTLRFRVGAVYEERYVSVYLGERRIIHRRRPILVPAEMQEVVLVRDQLLGALGDMGGSGAKAHAGDVGACRDLRVTLEEA